MEQLVLALDAGNTTTRFGVALAGELLATWEVSTDLRATPDEATMALAGFFEALKFGLARVDEAALGRAAASCGRDAHRLRRVLSEPGVRPVDGIVSSVVPALTDVWVGAAARLCGRRPLVVGPGLKTGLKMAYNNPTEVGADRVADMVALKATYGAPSVVVDLGTTTNIEVLNEKSEFAGGVLAPGLRLSAEALVAAAARLPMVDVRAPQSVIGRSTREAMQSGIVYGEVARIDGLLDMVFAEMGIEPRVVLSGHDAEVIAALMRHASTVDQTLTLRGLVLLHAANRK
ncbi:MAG: type III pantothenate kinase [Eggerthellaceae bacterium]|nr:type III pantothenate kinase [Eggerthellaceae bacterium]